MRETVSTGDERKIQDTSMNLLDPGRQRPRPRFRTRVLVSCTKTHILLVISWFLSFKLVKSRRRAIRYYDAIRARPWKQKKTPVFRALGPGYINARRFGKFFEDKRTWIRRIMFACLAAVSAVRATVFGGYRCSLYHSRRLTTLMTRLWSTMIVII